LENKTDGRRPGQVEGLDPDRIFNGDEKAKNQKQAGAISVTSSVDFDRNRAQHGCDGRNVRICVAVPGRRKNTST
jgi:hypothetical protein